jgi:hypothetical protein
LIKSVNPAISHCSVPPAFIGSIFSFGIFCWALFVLFLFILAIVLSVLRRLTVSAYLIVIFSVFLSNCCFKNIFFYFSSYEKVLVCVLLYLLISRNFHRFHTFPRTNILPGIPHRQIFWFVLGISRQLFCLDSGR